MARLEWNKQGERIFETGLDRGVFYPDDGPGVAWNGLTSVTETPDGGDASSYYLDGEKYLDVVSPEDFSGTIEALNTPVEFLPYDGMRKFQGLTITGQPRRKFGFSYRTMVGNDTLFTDFAYKIHLVYEAKILPTERSRKSNGESVEVTSISWNFVATPIRLSGNRKTAHYIIDTRDNSPERIELLESYLYGNDYLDPQLPSLEEVINILTLNSYLEIYPGINYPSDTLFLMEGN